MGSLMKKQAERFLREKKRHRRWLAVFLSLSLLVTSGTFAALRMNGHAMDHTDKVLNCRLRIHEHTEECFDSHGELTCGKADYVLHTHNGKCIDENGNLVCELPERKAHVHDSSCYTEERILTCQQEETAGHQHSEACYIEENGDLLCTLPEHQHSEGCYGEDGSLICGQEEHQHGEECFAKNQVLTCTEPESSGHTHSDSCYEVKKTLTCGQEEEIPHTHSEDCYDENGNLTCGLLELEEHEHGPGCFDDEEKPEEVKEEKENQPEDEPDGSVSGGETFANESPKEEHPKDEENNSEKPEETKAPEQKPTADDSKPEETVSSGSVSDDTVSENTASENAVSDNTLSGNSVSSDSLSGNTLSSNNVSDNSLSGNGVSGNSVSENTISLSANVGGTTITLSGPESSFEKDKELSIQAEEIISFKKANEQAAQAEENEEIKDDEQIETTEKAEEAKDSKQIEAIDEAVKKLAEEKEKEVKDYQAFDIKLLADGEEVQPLGPVEVKFSGRKVEKAVENKKTDVEVLHVGEDTGKSQDAKTAAAEEKEVVIETEGYSAQDMKATATEEKEVVIETEHFSVYVYVNLEDIFGKINVTVQHWGEDIKVLKGEAVAKNNTDTIIDQSTSNAQPGKAAPIQTEEKNYELYSADTLEIPNEYYANIEKLSKVCEVKPESAKAYDVSKVWISGGNTNSNKGETWAEGTYAEYTNNNGEWTLTKNSAGVQADQTKITLKDPSVIRFWYKPKEKLANKNYPVTFYDYDITDGTTQTVDGKTCYNSDRKGINANGNYPEGSSEANRLGVGQWSAGNFSSWAETNKGAKLTGGSGTPYLNQRPVPGPILEGMVQDKLTGENEDERKNGNLQFSSKVTVPNNLFTKESGNGKTVHSDYELSFQRYGDTLILDKVFKGSTEVESNLSKMTYMQSAWAMPPAVGAPMFSNNFWPMDAEQGADRHAGKTGQSVNFTNGSEVKTIPDKDGNAANDDQKYYPDESAHNWYFGMEFTVNFKVGDYTGPMEYYFRGDDDFWLFIDGELFVDIGGIHQVAGQSIDLRAEMEKRGMLTDKNEPHTMKIYYMERGAWGSCCYMQFILPNTEVVDIPEMETTEYSVTKDWDDSNSPYRPESIKVRLVQEWGPEGNKESRPTEEYTVLSAENNWKHTWSGIPLINGSTNGEYNYSYKVEEVNLPPGYTPVLVGGKLTNQLKPVKVEVEKVWQNDDGLESYRPESITLQLYANNEPYEDKNGNTKELILNEANGWSGVFDNLPEYYNYRLISEGDDPSQDRYDADKVIYSVKEIGTDGTTISNNGYLTTIEGAQYKVTYAREDYNLEETPISPPAASAPNKAPAFAGASQETPGLEDESSGEAEEDSESGEAADAEDAGATEDSVNGEIIEDSADGEADINNAEGDVAFENTNYGDAEEDVADEEINAQASYSMQRSAPAAVAETDSTDTEEKTVAKLTVTNTLDKNFKVVKRDSSDKNTGTVTLLSGAEFELISCNASGAPTEGSTSTIITSGEDGTLSPDWEALDVGYYLMKETKAPAGYMLSRTRWIIQIVKNFGMKEIGEVKSFEDYSDFNGPGGGGTSESISVNYAPGTNPSDGLVLTYTFYNDELYELPSTGGTGIYWYMIGGMFLMMGASLILYRNRSKKAVRGC